MKKTIATLLWIWILLCSFSFSSSPEQIKTLFVFNFIKFIEWAEKKPTTSIGFIGEDDALFNSFSEVAAKKSTAEKKINVEKITDLSTLNKYQLIYIAESGSQELSNFPEMKNTVIVTEKDGLAKKGSYINFINVDGKLRFEVNKGKFEASNTKISSQLLSLAIVI